MALDSSRCRLEDYFYFFCGIVTKKPDIAHVRSSATIPTRAVGTNLIQRMYASPPVDTAPWLMRFDDEYINVMPLASMDID